MRKKIDFIYLSKNEAEGLGQLFIAQSDRVRVAEVDLAAVQSFPRSVK